MEETRLTVKEILEATIALNNEVSYISEALKCLETVRSEGPNDFGAEAKANGIAKLVEEHEITRRQFLSLYSKMYDDIRNKEIEE